MDYQTIASTCSQIIGKLYTSLVNNPDVLALIQSFIFEIEVAIDVPVYDAADALAPTAAFVIDNNIGLVKFPAAAAAVEIVSINPEVVFAFVGATGVQTLPNNYASVNSLNYKSNISDYPLIAFKYNNGFLVKQNTSFMNYIGILKVKFLVTQ